jgi:hypothetical protein
MGEFCVDFTLYHIYADGSCGTYDVAYENNSPSCGYVAPTATPTATPIPPTATPLPTATPTPPNYIYISLSPGGSVSDACNATTGYYGYYLSPGETFQYATGIYSTNTGAQADAQWYSDGSGIVKFWDGTSITTTTNCDGSPGDVGP